VPRGIFRDASVPTVPGEANMPESMTPTTCQTVCPQAVRIITLLMMLAVGLWMLAGVIQLFLQLPQAFVRDWVAAAEHTIVNSLVLLALFEVVRTLQAYLSLGRVRVTFILDTALVVLIGELMGLWFREYTPEKVLLSLGVIATLVVLRIITARFSPESVP
jgi:uncharacterized membrane protein (DUF373 family)